MQLAELENNDLEYNGIDSALSARLWHLVWEFEAMHPPYNISEAFVFNDKCCSIYKKLTSAERKYADKMLDLLVEGLETRDVPTFTRDRVVHHLQGQLRGTQLLGEVG